MVNGGLDNRDLVQRIESARHRLARSVEDAALEHDGVSVWGRFADGPSAPGGQFGVYGTSAAVAVLARRAATPYDSLNCLPAASAESGVLPLFDQSDLHITFKVAAIVEALVEASPPDLLTRPVVRQLFGALVEERGWGYHTVPAEPDRRARVLPTAVVCAVAARHPDLAASDEVRRAAAWLERELLDDERMKGTEAAWIAIALGELRQRGVSTETMAAALDRAVRLLTPLLRERLAGPVEHVPRLYFVPKPQEYRDHILLFPDWVLVTHALLLADPAQARKRGVRTAVERLCDDVIRHGGVRAQHNDRLAMVDINLADQLLCAFQVARLETRSPLTEARIFRRFAWLPYAGAIAVLSGLTLGATLVALNIGQSGWITAGALTVASIAAGIVTTILLKWSRME